MGTPWTPGPWTRDFYGELIGANGKRVVFGNFGAGMVSAFENPEAVANTSLAHEAPAMAEALEQIEQMIDYGQYSAAQRIIETILIRIRGESAP